MTEPLIRKARPGEEAAVHEAHMRSIREVCVKDHGEEEIRGWGNRPLGNRWTDSIRDGHVWVVDDGGAVRGVGSLDLVSVNGETQARITALYLAPEVLGQGLGRALAQQLLKAAKTAGARIVTLDSTITAHEFYKKLGFADTGQCERHEIGGHPVTCFPMALKLDTIP